MALNNVPLAGQNLLVTRNPINANFNTINAAFLVDHVEYNIAGQGKHNKVTMPVQALAPVFAGTDNGIYSLVPTAGALTGIQEIFLHKQSAAGVREVPMTASILSTSAAPAALSSGWAYLPSGILLKWAANVNANGSTVINFPVGANIPVYNTCITVLVSVAAGGAGDVNRAIRISAVNPGNFTAYGSQRTAAVAANTVFTYLAIGY